MRPAALLTLPLWLALAAAAPEVPHVARENVLVPADAMQPVEHSPDIETPGPGVPPPAADEPMAQEEDGEAPWQEGVLTRVRKSCPPYGAPCKKFCIEVRPRDPRQTPFIICEPPQHAVDDPSPPLPPYYPYTPPYPYPPEYELAPYPPPAPKDPVPAYPPYSPPYYKPPYYPQYSSNAASSAAASATATTALHGLGGGVPHLRDADEDSAAEERSSSVATASTADARSVFGAPYRQYGYPPPDGPYSLCCHDQRYPAPHATPPVALLQLFLRPSHHHHHHILPPYYPVVSEFRDDEARDADAAQPGATTAGPMKVDLNVEHGKADEAMEARSAAWPPYGWPMAQPGMMYGMYGYPGMPYASPEYPGRFYKEAEPQSVPSMLPGGIAAVEPIKQPAGLPKPGATPLQAGMDKKPASGSSLSTSSSPAASMSSPAAATLVPTGPMAGPGLAPKPLPSQPGSMPPPALPSQPGAIPPPMKPPPQVPSTSAVKPKEAEEPPSSEARMAFMPHHGFPHRYGYGGHGGMGHFGGGFGGFGGGFGGGYGGYPGGMMHHGMNW